MKFVATLQPRTDGVVMLRPLEAGDSARLVAGRDEEWHRWLGPGRDYPEPAACIVVAEEVVGWIDYDDDLDWLDTGEVNIGYNVFAAHRRNGYASRALELLIRYLDEYTAVQTATLLIDPRNAPSLAVADRNRFVASGAVGPSRFFKRSVRGASDRSAVGEAAGGLARYGRVMRAREVTCEACDARVRVDFTKDNVTSTRELVSTPAPGRVTIRVGDEVVHQCEDGTFRPPDNVTAPE